MSVANWWPVKISPRGERSLLKRYDPHHRGDFSNSIRLPRWVFDWYQLKNLFEAILGVGPCQPESRHVETCAVWIDGTDYDDWESAGEHERWLWNRGDFKAYALASVEAWKRREFGDTPEQIERRRERYRRFTRMGRVYSSDVTVTIRGRDARGAEVTETLGTRGELKAVSYETFGSIHKIEINGTVK